MSLRWLLISLTVGWVWVDGYPQWQRCRLAQARAAELRSQIERYEEGLKYLPALRQALETHKPPQPAGQPETRVDLQLSIQPEMMPSPTRPEEAVPGYKIRLAGPRVAVLNWTRALLERFSIEKLELQVHSDQIHGHLLILGER
jgi:hypothetical protein